VSKTDRLFSELFIERHENVSMLFADICKFTELTTRLPVDKLVKTLNDLFGKFDLAAEVKITTLRRRFIQNLIVHKQAELCGFAT
jgi:hypothetical protein